MTTRVRLSSEAETELAEAVRWYETRRAGLGEELLATVHQTLSLIADRPEIGRAVPSVHRADVKRVVVPRFPYQIVYRERAQQIVIVAVAHLKRRPGYWVTRS